LGRKSEENAVRMIDCCKFGFSLWVAASFESQAANPIREIKIDPMGCAEESRTLPWSLGSASIRVLGHKDKKCHFEYTIEVEGGYTIYDCAVPRDGPLIMIKETSSQDSDDYGARRDVRTSFSLKACETRKSGNFFQEFRK
jgi:hypothetical protein